MIRKKGMILEIDDQKKRIEDFFLDLPNGDFRDLGVCRVCGVERYEDAGCILYLGVCRVCGVEPIPCPSAYNAQGVCRVCGVEQYVCGFKTKTGELIYLASHGISGQEAADMYMLRWNIETGFKQLKSSMRALTPNGFNVQSTRLQCEGKMDLLFAILAIAMAWCYSCGDESQKTDPIKRASHGRKLESVFRCGLDLLRGWLLGTGGACCRVFEKMISLFSNAVAFVSSALPAAP